MEEQVTIKLDINFGMEQGETEQEARERLMRILKDVGIEPQTEIAGE